MSDPQLKIPSFNDVMQGDTLNGKIPSFKDIMGEDEPIKKKVGLGEYGKAAKGRVPSQSKSGSGGVGFGGMAEIAKKVLDESPEAIAQKKFDDWIKDKPAIYFESTDPLGDAIKTQRTKAAPFIYPDQTTGKPTNISWQQSASAINKLREDEAEISNAFGDDIEAAENYLQSELAKKNVRLAPKSNGKIPGLSDYMAQQQTRSLTDTPIQEFETDEIAKAIDPRNKTQVAAFNTMNRIRRLNTALQTGSSIADMAAKYKGERLDELPQAKAGARIDEFLSLPQVQQLAETDHDFAVQYQNEKKELYDKYPSFAQKKIGQAIAQRLENKGMTGWLYANPSANKVEKVIESLVEDGTFGEEEVLAAQKYILPFAKMGASDKVLPLTDLVHNAGYGVYKGFSDVANSARDILNRTVGGGFLDPQGNSVFQNLGLMETNEDRMKRLEQEEWATPHVTGRTGFRKFIQEGGEFAGFTLPMLLGGELKIPQAVTMGLMFEGKNADEARKMFPNDIGKQNLYTLLGTGIDMSLGELLPIKQASAGIKKTLMNDVKATIEDLSNKKITGDAAKAELGQKITSFLTNTAKENTKTGAVLTAFKTAHNALDAAFGQRKFNLSTEVDEILDNAKTNFLSGTFLSMAGAAGKLPNSKENNSKIYLEAANYPEKFQAKIDEIGKGNPTLAKEMTENLQHLVEVNKVLEKQNVDPGAIGWYLGLSLRQKALEAQVKNSPDKDLMRSHDREIREIKLEKQQLTDPDMTNQKFIEEMYNEDLLPAGSKMLLEVEGKFSPAKVGDYLKFIAQQANGFDENWKPLEGGGREMNLPQSVIETANERWAKEIEAAQPKEEIKIDQEREIDNGNEPKIEANENGLSVQEQIERLNTSAKVAEESAKHTSNVDDKNRLLENAKKYREEANSLSSPSQLGKEDEGGGFRVGKIDKPNVISSVEQYKSYLKSALLNKPTAEFDGIEKTLDKAEQDILNDTRSSKESKDLGIEAIRQLREEMVSPTPTTKEVSNEKVKSEANTENQQGELEAETTGEPVEQLTENIEGTEPPKSAPGEVKEVPEGNSNLIGITHEQLNKVASELGMPEYEGSPETVAEWDATAVDRLNKDPQAIHKMLNRFENGKIDDPVDQRMMLRYVASLKDRIDKNPSRELLDEFKRARRLSDISGRMLGKSLVARKGSIEVSDNLADFLLDKEEAQGFPLRPSQIEAKTKEFNDLKKAKEDLETQLEKEREQHSKMVAEYGFNKARAMAKQAGKRSSEDYKKERADIKNAASAALKKLREQPLQSSNPLSEAFKTLKAISPHVKDYVKSLINEGYDKLDVVVAKVKAEFQDLIDISSSDILDIVGGKYDEQKLTRNDIAAQMRQFKREAQLLKELEAARKGEEAAKTEDKKNPYSRRIEELKEKIKEVREKNEQLEMESPEDNSTEIKSDAERDKAYQKTILNKIKRLEEDLKNKNYSKEPVTPKPFAKSQKTKILEDKVIAIEKKLAEERYKDEQSKLSGWQKAWDKAQQILGIRRIFQTTLDASIWLRQLGSLVLNPRKWGVAKEFIKAGGKSAFSQKQFDRAMNDIHKTPDYKETVDDGIRYNEIDKPNEFYPKSFIYKVPVLKQILGVSQRIADASLNVARYELYQKYKKELLRNGVKRENEPEQYKEMAKLVMNATGSGNMLKAFESPKMEKLLGATFYGSRLMAANFNTLNPVYYAKMPGVVRKAAMKDLASYSATMLTTALGLAASGGNIQLDPDKPDFLQLRFGKKVYDITGGKAAYIRTFMRWVEAGHAAATKSKYEAEKAAEFATFSSFKFWANKLAPNTGYAATAVLPRKFTGRDFDWRDIYQQSVPLWFDDAWKAAKEDGFLSLATVVLPNLLGIGYNSYYSEPAQQDLDDLKERNMRSDELNKETLKDYTTDPKGKAVTNKQFSEYATRRDAEIEKGLERLYNEGALVLENGEVKLKKFKDLTKEEIIAETSDIKANATRKAKKKMFGEKEKDGEEDQLKQDLRQEKKDRFPKEYDEDEDEAPPPPKNQSNSVKELPSTIINHVK